MYLKKVITILTITVALAFPSMVFGAYQFSQGGTGNTAFASSTVPVSNGSIFIGTALNTLASWLSPFINYWTDNGTSLTPATSTRGLIVNGKTTLATTTIGELEVSATTTIKGTLYATSSGVYLGSTVIQNTGYDGSDLNSPYLLFTNTSDPLGNQSLFVWNPNLKTQSFAGLDSGSNVTTTLYDFYGDLKVREDLTVDGNATTTGTQYNGSLKVGTLNGILQGVNGLVSVTTTPSFSGLISTNATTTGTHYVGTLVVDSLNGVLQATNGVVSQTTTPTLIGITTNNATTTNLYVSGSASLPYGTWIGSALGTNSFQFNEYTFANGGIFNGVKLNKLDAFSDATGMALNNNLVILSDGENNPSIYFLGEGYDKTPFMTFATSSDSLIWGFYDNAGNPDSYGTYSVYSDYLRLFSDSNPVLEFKGVTDGGQSSNIQYTNATDVMSFNNATQYNFDNLVSASSVTTTNLYLNNSGAGYVPFFNSSKLMVFDSLFNWDDTNNRLGLGVTAPVAGIHSSSTDGLLVTGQYNSGWTGGDLGAGTRLMFIPSKGAFRAGRITGTEWDADNVGIYSFAGGLNAKCDGSAAVCIGTSINSTGTASSVFGSTQTEGGGYNFISGLNHEVYGLYNLISGSAHRVFNHNYSIALGHDVDINNDYTMGVNLKDAGTLDTTQENQFILGADYFDVDADVKATIDSPITYVSGKLGVGSSTPNDILDVYSASSTSGYLAYFYNDQNPLFRIYKAVVNGIIAAFGTLTSYTGFEQDGTMVATGNATTWNDINIGFVTLGKGATAPSDVRVSTTDIYLPAFDGSATTEQLFGCIELMHDYKEGSTIYPHIHWLPTTADSGNVVWQVSWVRSDGVGTGLPAQTTASSTSAAGGAWVNAFAYFGGITTSAKIGDQLCFRVFRNPTDPSDTYEQDAMGLTFGIHYEQDTNGSRNITTK